MVNVIYCNLTLHPLRSAQSQRTVVSTLSASNSLSRIPIKRNSSLRRKKEVMENYNNLRENTSKFINNEEDNSVLAKSEKRQSFPNSTKRDVESKNVSSSLALTSKRRDPSLKKHQNVARNSTNGCFDVHRMDNKNIQDADIPFVPRSIIRSKTDLVRWVNYKTYRV